MTRQKSKFWAFLFSLCPGCGQLYLGFKKRGLTLMVYFWASIAIATELSLSAFVFVSIIVWFFAFFDTMNLNGAPPEAFLQERDQYLLPTDDNLKFVNKYKIPRYIGIALIVFGIFILWQSVALSYIYRYFPNEVYYFLSDLTQYALRVLLAVVVIVVGFKLVRGKKEQLENAVE